MNTSEDQKTITERTWSASSDLGPRMLKATNKAIRSFTTKAGSVLTTYGTIGGEEYTSESYIMFGDNPWTEQTLADYKKTGDFHGWTVSKANYKQIQADLEAIAAKEGFQHVKDERKTPAQEAERNAEYELIAKENRERIQKAEQKREVERKEAQDAYPYLVSDNTKNRYALGAANIRRELSRKWPSVKFSVRSKSFSMGDSIDVSWTDGPSGEEVDKIISKYNTSTFDAYQDLSIGCSDGFNDMFGGSKYVRGSRDYSPEIEKQVRDLVEANRDNINEFERDQEAWRYLQDTSLLEGQQVVGFILSEGDYGCIEGLKLSEVDTPTESEAKAESTSTECEGFRLVENVAQGGIEIYFDAKPDADTIATIKGNRFRWSRRNKCWYARKTNAQALAYWNKLKGNTGEQDAPSEQSFAQTWGMADANY